MSNPGFVSLLLQLSLPDNVARKSAESQYEQMCNTRTDEVPHMLLLVICDKSTGVTTQRLAAVLLRRMLIQISKGTITHLSPPSLAQLRRDILQALDREKEVFLKSRICDIVGLLCDDDMQDSEWPELLPYTYSCLQGTDPTNMEMGLALLGMLAPCFIDKFLLPGNAARLMSFLDNCLKSTVNVVIPPAQPSTGSGSSSSSAIAALGPTVITHFRLQIAAVRSLSDILSSLPQESDCETFSPLIPSLLVAMQRILQLTQMGHVEKTTACTFAENMIDIAENCESFFGTVDRLGMVFEPIVGWIQSYTNSISASITGAAANNSNNTSLHRSVAHLLIEFCVTISNACPKVVRKLKGGVGAQRAEKNYFAIRMLPICVQLMNNIKEDAEWNTKTTVEGEGDDEDVDDGSDIDEDGDVCYNTASNDDSAAGSATGAGSGGGKGDNHANTRDSDVGESALDRICHSLGLRSTYGIVSAQLVALFTSPNWREQHSGLRYLGNYVEVTATFTDKKLLNTHRREVLSIVLQFSRSAHFRVRAAAYYALNQFLIMHGGAILTGSYSNSHANKELHQQLVTAVMSNVLEAMTVKVNPPPRVRRYVMACLINLIGSCISAATLEQPMPAAGGGNGTNSPNPGAHPMASASGSEASSGSASVSVGSTASTATNLTGNILTAVVLALNEGPVMVQEYCVSIIISLAETVRGHQFGMYYDSLMPVLKQLLIYTRQQGLETFWGSVIECIAIVGESSGRQLFFNDATEMMNYLVGLSATLDEESEMRRYILKAWVRIARCLGAEFLPFLQIVMEKLFLAISQDVNVSIAEGADEEQVFAEMEQRSDVLVLESPDGGWVAVRSAAVEEQSSACQLLIFLIEKMQEHFSPFVERTVILLQPLLTSPHEDVRSYCLVAFPELVRSIAKATVPDRTALLKLSDFLLGLLVKSLETEGTLELIMTCLQATKQVLFYLCTDWASHLKKCEADADKRIANQSEGGGNSNNSSSSSGGGHNSGGRSLQQQKADRVAEVSLLEPPTPTPGTSIRSLNEAQMNAITDSSKIVLRDSLQRRAVLRAQAQIASGGAGGGSSSGGGGDEDDAADEQLFMRDSMELHFNVAELIGAILRTHGDAFMQCYMNNWHEMIHGMTNNHCLKEDKQFAYFVIADVIEFGLPTTVNSVDSSSTAAYLGQVLPSIISTLASNSDDASLRQTLAYSLGVAAQRFPLLFAPHAPTALQALAAAIQAGEDRSEGEMRGPCTDNCVSTVGIVLEGMELLMHSLGSTAASVMAQMSPQQQQQRQQLFTLLSQIPYGEVWGQWLSYLPLYHDRDEGLKVYSQLCRLLRNRNASLLGPMAGGAGMDASSSGGGGGDIYSQRSVMVLSVLLQVLQDSSIAPSSTTPSTLLPDPTASTSTGANGISSTVTSDGVKYDAIESVQFLKVGRNPVDMARMQQSVMQFAGAKAPTSTGGNSSSSGSSIPIGGAAETLWSKLQEVLTTPPSVLFNRATGRTVTNGGAATLTGVHHYNQGRASSPLAHAPIEDVLMMR